MVILIWIAGIFSIFSFVCNGVHYSADWKSLDSRPLPKWYDQSKVGIFIHWGVFAVPGFGDFKHAGEWFWWYWQGVNMTNYKKFMIKNYPPSFTYADFAKQFRAESFNPDYWADLFNASGAQYVVLTSKHHEGYCNWNSKYSWNWNSVDIGPNMDLVDMLSTSIRKRTKLVFGLYHSLFEWFNPLYLADKNSKFKTNSFVKEKTLPELYEIVNRYKPDVIWSDGDWETTDTYWNSTEFLAWLYNDSPVKDTVVTNDRWGSGTTCKHGGFYTCEDRYNPGKLVNHKWENCFTLDKYSWGFRKEMTAMDVMTIEEVIGQVASTVSCGGNVLINIGPTSYGTIPPLFQERLLQLGQWLSVNGESIYNTKPWSFQNDSISQNVWYTSQTNTKSNSVYAILLEFPVDGRVKLGNIKFSKKSTEAEQIVMLGYGNILYQKQTNYTLVLLPTNILTKLKWAWTLKISGMID